MAKMIPKIISDSASIAEKKVFYESEKLNDDYTIFHSVNLPKQKLKVVMLKEKREFGNLRIKMGIQMKSQRDLMSKLKVICIL